MLVALAVVSIYGGSIAIIVIVLGLLLWDRFAVVLRSATMQARHQDYVRAARAIGCSTPFIIVSEILPNIAGQLVIVGTVEMAAAILLEAALSFLGLGVQPPAPSLGLMLADGKGDMFGSTPGSSPSPVWCCSCWYCRSTWWATAFATSAPQACGGAVLLEVEALDVDFPALGHLHPVRDFPSRWSAARRSASSANPDPANRSPRSR